MTDIYDAHRAAFANVAAYTILRDGVSVAKVAFKFGNAVTAYVHWIGAEMVRSTAKGGGYDRQSAAVAGCAAKISDDITGKGHNLAGRAEFIDACHDRDGRTWYNRLTDAGFVVIQAV